MPESAFRRLFRPKLARLKLALLAIGASIASLLLVAMASGPRHLDAWSLALASAAFVPAGMAFREQAASALSIATLLLAISSLGALIVLSAMTRN